MSRRRRISRLLDFVISRFTRSSITRFLVLYTLVSPTCSPLLLALDLSVSQIASGVDRRYNRLNTLKANFEENYSGAGLTRNESGKLWLQKPGKMRWEYEQPAPKLFIVDGKNAFFYVPAERQVRRMPAKKLDDFRSPIRYLLGHTKLEKEFSKLVLSSDRPDDPSDVVLEGIPNGMEDRVQRVLLEITPANQICRIRVEELDGSTTEFLFRDLEENVAVQPNLFRFNPPAGVEIVSGQDLEP